MILAIPAPVTAEPRGPAIQESIQLGSNKAPIGVGLLTAQITYVAGPEETNESFSQRHIPPREWTRPMQKRFDKLAGLYASGLLDGETLSELKDLTKDRSRLLAPLSASEVINQLQRRRIIEKMVSALSEYAQFNKRQT